MSFSPYVMTRTAAAFTFSAERLFDEYQKIYFWTFTFIDVPINDELANDDWHTLHHRMRRVWPNLKGLKVTELHRSHGIHYHALVNMRIPIERVKRLARGSGALFGDKRYLDFGRMEVKRCDRDAVAYLTSYLRKGYKAKYNVYAGRRWGTIGGFAATHCRDIVYDHLAIRNREAMFGGFQVSYSTILMIQHYTDVYGHYQDWPEECQSLVWRQKGPGGVEWMQHFNAPF